MLSSLSPAAARERKQNAWGGCERSTRSASQRVAVPGGALKKCPDARVLPSPPAARSGRAPCPLELDPEHVSPSWGPKDGFNLRVACSCVPSGRPPRPEPPPQANERAQPSLRSDNSVSHSFSCAAERRAARCRGGLACRGARGGGWRGAGTGGYRAGGAHRAGVPGEPRAYRLVPGCLGRSLPERADNYSVGKQVLLFCSGFNVKRRAAGLPAGSRRQGLQAASSSRAQHGCGHLPGRLQAPPAASLSPSPTVGRGAASPGRGKGSRELALPAAGRGHATPGTSRAGLRHPRPGLCRVRSCFSPPDGTASRPPELTARRRRCLCFGALPGAQQTAPAPAVTLGAGPPARP